MKHYSQAAVEQPMKVQEVILRAIANQITWSQDADDFCISPRRMRCYEEHGYDGFFGHRTGKPFPKFVPLEIGSINDAIFSGSKPVQVRRIMGSISK